MKNRPPCCGLWLPCARGAYFFTIGEPSGQVPGVDRLRRASPGTSTRPTSSPARGRAVDRDICPASSSTTSSGRARTSTPSRGGSAPAACRTSRHLPGWSSMTSSSPAIGQTYEMGGSSVAARGGLRASAARAAGADGERDREEESGRSHRPSNLCYTPRMARHADRPFAAAAIAAAPVLRRVWSRVRRPRHRRAPRSTTFWSAASPGDAARARRCDRPEPHDLRRGVPTPAAGPPLRPQRDRLVRLSNRTSDGVEHHFALNVPDDLRSRRAAIRCAFSCTAASADARPTRRSGTGAIGALAGAEQIYIIPYAWDGRALVERRSGAEPARDPRHREAPVQHRRKPRRRLGRVRRRHRRVLRRDARHDAVRELPAAQRLHHGAREPRHRRRR